MWTTTRSTPTTPCGGCAPSPSELTWSGHKHEDDESVLSAVARHCERIAEQEGWLVGKPVEYTVIAYSTTCPAA